MDHGKFFAGVKASLFHNKLAQTQVDGMNAILAEWEAKGLTDERWLAYMLATAYHETAQTMQPVRETMASTDDKAIAILDKALRDGKLKQVKSPYWRKDANGRSWLGRGLVQLTHYDNYLKFGLDKDPARAMEMPIAVKIMFSGMRIGMFTGKKLSDYFSGDLCDWTGARKIINGTDKAALIAGYAKQFYAAIEDA